MYYWLAGSFIAGMVALGFFRPKFWKLVRKFQNKAPLVKKYWVIVIPFLILTVTAYVLVAFFANSQTNFEIVGQLSALIFAIFVGYIAFAEWSKTKFDDLVTKASASAEQGSFETAKRLLKEAHTINPKNSDVLGDLLEMYLLTENTELFDENIDKYRSMLIEKRDHLYYFFLHATRYLLVENLRLAKEIMKESIIFVSENKDLQQKFAWRLREMHSSEPYKNLDASTKRRINNYHSYLGGNLSAAKEAAFLQGQYDTQDID